VVLNRGFRLVGFLSAQLWHDMARGCYTGPEWAAGQDPCGEVAFGQRRNRDELVGPYASMSKRALVD